MLPGGVDTWIPVVGVATGTIPAAALVLRGWRIGRGTPAALASRTAWTEVGMVAGTLPWIWMILTPLPGPRTVFLVPFVDLAHQVAGGPVWLFLEVGGNLLVFAAFGFLAPIRWRISPRFVLVTAALGSATVEALQYVLDLGRVTSVDDVLVNALGAELAALCSRRWWAVAIQRPDAAADPVPDMPATG